jgi:hypothetical protein
VGQLTLIDNPYTPSILSGPDCSKMFSSKSQGKTPREFDELSTFKWFYHTLAHY